MRELRFFLMILPFLGFFVTTQINASPVYPFDMAALSELEETNDPALFGVEDGDVYLNPEKIAVNKEGIFLSTQGSVLLQLNSVIANKAGLYTRIPELSNGVATVWPAVIQCRNCQKYFSKNLFNKGVCPRCNTQN